MIYPAFGRDFRGGGGAGQITKISYCRLGETDESLT